MSSTRRKQNNPTKSASDLKKKARVSRAAKAALSSDQDAEPSLARSRPQRKIIPKRPLSPDIELSSRRKRRRKKKAPATKAKSKNPSLGPTHAVHIQPNELKPPKLSKQHKASLKKKKKRKKKTFIFPILASDRIPRDLGAAPSDKSESDAEGSIPVDLGAKIKKKKSKASSRNILDIGQLRMLPAADLVRKFSKHTSFKIPSEDGNTTVTQKQHVYTCRMLPHYCTEKFYGNEEDTKRQITKHLLRHVGELLTVTDRGLNLLPPTVKKQKPKKKNKREPVVPPSDDIKSAMYILPSAPRPMRVTLPKNVTSRMKRTNYTVIRSGGDNEIVTEVVLLPKGRLLSMFNAPSKIKGAQEDGKGEDELVSRDEEEEEDEETSTGMLMPLGGADNKVEMLPINASSGKGEAEGDSTSTGLSIESLAEAVEALVSKESQGLNIQAAEALAKEMTVVKEEPCDSDVEGTSDSISSKSELLSLSGSTAPSSSSKPSSSTALKKPVKVKKVGKRSKKSVTIIHAVAPTLVKCPYPDHSYAYASCSENPHNSPLHLDSDGRPMDEPFFKEDIEFASGVEPNRLTESMNVELNQLIAGMEEPQPPSRVKVLNENEVPVVWEGANETVEHVAMQRKQKKIKLKVVPTNSGPSEEVKQTAMFHLQSLTKDRKRKGPFECQICHKHLTAASTLRAHYRSHAGIKPYQCEQCNATFTRLHSLKYHTMIHNEEARFLCSYCHRQFRHSSHYREHLRRHTGEEPFGCSDCSARFKTRNTYKRHLRSKHGKVVAENGKINLAPANMLSLASTVIPPAPDTPTPPPDTPTPPIPSVTG